jgi:hypothetical protein
MATARGKSSGKFVKPIAPAKASKTSVEQVFNLGGTRMAPLTKKDAPVLPTKKTK